MQRQGVLSDAARPLSPLIDHAEDAVTTPPPPGRPVNAGAPFAVMLRGAFVPSVVAGVLAIAAMVLWRGTEALAGAALGLLVTLAFFSSGMLLMSRLVRSASPHAFFAVAMAVYLGQVLLLLLFIIAFRGADWVDGRALGLVALVVTLAWQGFAMLAWRRARVLVYDEPTHPSRGQGRT